MANRKTYEMLFALNAQMNGNFSASFSKAQAEFARLGKEVQQLHRIQGDVASYQKQQTAIENTRSKLENLQKQHDLLQKEIDETTGSTVALEREKVKLEQRVKDAEAALERQGQKLGTTGERLKAAGVDTTNLAQKDAELTARLKELELQQEKASEGAVNFGKRSSQAFEAIQEAIAAAGVAAALKEITDAYMECVNSAAGFEESMSAVEALSGAAAGELEQLSDMAKEMGAATKFTAQESADAFQYMALAGWDTQKMLAGIGPILNLAAAAGMDLATTSDIVTDYLTAFGLTANDTATFVDQMAYAMAHSNTNVIQLGEAYKACAATAKSMGYSVEDTTAVLMTMANAGVKGGEAGTALNAVMTRLATDTKDCASALEEYGVYVYDAQGRMQSLSSILNGVSGVWAQLTDEQQAGLAKAIAGTNHYSKLQTIMSGCSEAAAKTGQSFNDYAAALQHCDGAAGKMSATMLDNMNGQLVLMDSAFDALKTTIGEQFIPEMRGLYQIGTDVFIGLNKFVKANPALVKGVITFTGVMGGAAAAITGANAALKVFQALSLTSLAANPFFLAAGAAGALAAGIAALSAAADDSVPSVKELTEAARDMEEAMDEADSAYQQTAAQTIATAELAGIYIDRLREIEAETDGATEGNQDYQNTLALLLRTMPELSDSVSQTTDEYGRAIYTLETSTDALAANTEAWKRNAEAQAYQEYLNDIYDDYNAVMLEAVENNVKLTEAETAYSAAEQKRAQALRRIMELQRQGEQAAKEYYNQTGALVDSSYFTGQNQEYADLVASVNEYEETMREAKKTAKVYREAIEDDSAALAEAEERIDSAKEALQTLDGAMDGQTESQAEAARQTQELGGIIDGVAQQISALAESYANAYGAALESISGQYELWDQAANVTEINAAAINAALESQTAYWRDYNANLQSLAQRSGEIEGLSAVIASFADGSQDSVNAIAGLANASDEDLREMVANWQVLQEEQKAAAGSVAELKTDFTETMDELQTALAEDIEAMDLSEQAAASARATLQGYLNGANDMMPQVNALYRDFARTVSNSLAGAAYGGRSYGANSGARGYASGTESAKPGWAMVGENGPELMFFHGGEKVLNAAQTAALRAEPESAILDSPNHAGNSSPSVQVVFQLEGNVPPETVSALQAYGDDFAERVLDVIQNAETDRIRSAYH